jgi:hypothetical protein
MEAVPVDAHNVGLEAQNEVVKVCRKVASGSASKYNDRSRFCIKVEGEIRIRVNLIKTSNI